MQASKVWDDYWQYQTTSNSFASEYSDGDGPYEVVASTWLDAFSNILPDHTIVDLGSGSGALLNLLSTKCPHVVFDKWINVDYANVKPLATAANTVEWVKADFTALDMDSDAIDHVFSMFGFEYANAKKACAELVRVLKDGGVAMLMCHHPESMITSQSKISMAAHRAIKNDKIFHLPKKVQASDITHIRRHCLSRLMYQLDHNPETYAEDIKLIGNKIHQALHASNDPQQVIGFLQQVEHNLALYSERLAQQIASAQNVTKIMHAFESLQDCDVESEVLDFQGQPIAYLLKVGKHQR